MHVIHVLPSKIQLTRPGVFWVRLRQVLPFPPPTANNAVEVELHGIVSNAVAVRMCEADLQVPDRAWAGSDIASDVSSSMRQRVDL